jgi:hypothetical protein
MSRVEKRNSMRGTKTQHSYLLDGSIKLPGVTTILGALSKGDALNYWASKMGGRYGMENAAELWSLPEDVRDLRLGRAHAVARDAAGEIGTQFHGFAQRLALGEPVSRAEIREADPDLLRMLMWARKFLDSYQFKPLLTETVVWSLQHRYAGTLDLVASSPLFPGRVFLLDWKTGGVYRDAALQLAAYANADFYVSASGEDGPMGELEITDHVVLKIDQSEGRVVPVPLATGPEVFDYFLTAKAAYERRVLDKTLVSKDELTRPQVEVLS